MSVAASAHATSFVNGDFSSNAGVGQIGYNTSATGWYMLGGGGYTFLFATGTADTTGSSGSYGFLSLWGSNNGGADAISASPSGSGYFIAEDGDFQTASIAQDISGLTIGKTYTVSFNYAYAQQSGFYGATTQDWGVTLGDSAAQYTPTLTNPSTGFTGWFSDSMKFTADATSETLAFAAYGSAPVPPFALLDGVNVTASAAPEPASWAMMLMGFGGLGFAARKRRRPARLIA